MPKTVYDVIVIGTGAGGGMAIKTLCEAGLKVCALNSGRRINPARDFRNHRMPYEMKYRGFGDPRKRAQSYGYMDNEYVGEGIWEHGITYTTAPGTEWMWPRCHAVGGKTNFWGRSSARFGDIDFRAATLDGYDVDWPMTYEEIAPYYSRVEKMIGVASTVQNRPSNPDGEYLPPMKLRCLDHILQRGAEKVGAPYLPDRIAQLTRSHNDHPACHFCGNCTDGCDTGSFFSTPWFLLPLAEKTGNLELRTNAVVRSILVDEKGRAKGRRLYRPRHAAGGGNLRTRRGGGGILRGIGKDHAEFEVALLAGGDRQLQWPARAQPLRPLVWGHRTRVPAAASGSAELPRQRFRQHHRVDAALAESEKSSRGDVHSRLLDLPGGRMRRVPVVSAPPRRLWQRA